MRPTRERLEEIRKRIDTKTYYTDYIHTAYTYPPYVIELFAEIDHLTKRHTLLKEDLMVVHLESKYNKRAPMEELIQLIESIAESALQKDEKLSRE